MEGPELAEVARTCPTCKKVFVSVSNRNLHMKNIHKMESHPQNKEKRITCAICKEIEGSYKIYFKHLKEVHQVSMNEEYITFSRKQDYEIWKAKELLEVRYVACRRNKRKEYVEEYYTCNKTDTHGYKSNCTKRMVKSGGTIKLENTCPSRVVVKIHTNGGTTVMIQRRHIGHDENELRSLRLSSTEKNSILEKLQMGVNTERILEDSQKMNTNELKRSNLLSRKDVWYLNKKHNISKSRHANQIIATSLKVEEWNANGKNYAFLFKPEGMNHEVLRKEDFCLGFMNAIMENKLHKYDKIICMDGTHCTNNKNLELTIMLVKDEKNAGFPVAFFLSNRKDQLAQEVFLGALKLKIGKEIKPMYFMSDDDGKYYNAWTTIMKNTPRRLLCSWHIIKNWNTQGRAKIKDGEVKKTMKADLKKILNETNEDRFLKLVEAYFEKLKENNEVDFLNYLKKYYFQVDRIEMWAHCYRKNAGVNTNMAIESLNNFLKTNQLKRRCNVTVERLLDTIEKLVDNKMWRRILNTERPNANNYQDRIISKAHKKAASMKNVEIVIMDEEGHYQVMSSTGNNLYNIFFNKLSFCENENCKTLYCKVCNVCIHSYTCECPEYTIKNTICKHIHLVHVYVTERAAGLKTKNEETKFTEDYQEEKAVFIEEKLNSTSTIDSRKEELDEFTNFANNLDQSHYKKLMDKINKIREEMEIEGNGNSKVTSEQT